MNSKLVGDHVVYINYAGKQICVRSDDKKTTTYFYKNWCGYEIEVERWACVGAQYKFRVHVRRLGTSIVSDIYLYTNIREAVQYSFNCIAQDVKELEDKQAAIRELIETVKLAVS